jgi:hypothetical protein
VNKTGPSTFDTKTLLERLGRIIEKEQRVGKRGSIFLLPRERSAFQEQRHYCDSLRCHLWHLIL